MPDTNITEQTVTTLIDALINDIKDARKRTLELVDGLDQQLFSK